MDKKRIGMRQDGKNYVFEPGVGGSLTARALNKKQETPLINKPKAKVIPKERANVAKSLAMGKSGY